VESAAAFDSYVVEHGLASADAAGRGSVDPAAARAGGDPAAARGAGGGGRGGASGRFTGGRSVLALDFLQGLRRRQILMREMALAMADVDMYVTSSGDVGLTNQTGHPAVVVPTGFGERPQGGGGRAQAAPPAPSVPQPLVTTLIGALFNDDKILSVAHAYQMATDWHTKHPKLQS
jgi:hypothetical protein